MLLVKTLNPALEGGSVEINLVFTYPDGTAGTPTGCTWTLKDEDGTVIKEDQQVTPLASEMQFLIYGDDLIPGDLELTVTVLYSWLSESSVPQVRQATIPVTAQ